MLISKLPNVGTTIFTTMSQLAADTGALNLSQGFPDFDGPQALREAVARHVMAGHNQYAPMTGLPALREQVAAKVAGLYGRDVDAAAEVTITPGATQAIFCAIQAVIRPGDEVIVFDPCYDSYEPSVQLAGGVCIHQQLSLPDFRIDWQRLADAITPRTRMIVLNTPHNPSGALIDADDLDRLAALIRERDIYLLSDEVYEHLVFDGREHASVLRHDELYQRAFVISSFGKTYHVTGWKTGYVVAPPMLSVELRKVHQYVSFTGVTPARSGPWPISWPLIPNTWPNCRRSTRPSAICSAICWLVPASALPVLPAPTSSSPIIRRSAPTSTTSPWPSG